RPVAATVSQNTLAIGAGSKLSFAANGTTSALSVLSALSIAGGTDVWTGQLDVNDNDVVLHSSSANRVADVARITNQLKQGLNAAGNSNTALFWSGNGIVTSSGWKGGSNY